VSSARNPWALDCGRSLGDNVFNPQTLRDMAADYRSRAETATNVEQRARHVSFADHCEQLAMAMALRPRGLATRCADALRRCARAAKARTGRSWQGEGD
jgi:hypothetical protein